MGDDVLKAKTRLAKEFRSITEKKPDKNQQCLVVDKDGYYGVGYYIKDIDAWDSPLWGFLERKDEVDNYEAYTMPCGMGKVVAWIPLPEVHILHNPDKYGEE